VWRQLLPVRSYFSSSRWLSWFYSSGREERWTRVLKSGINLKLAQVFCFYDYCMHRLNNTHYYITILGAVVAQLASALLSEREVPGSIFSDFNVCFDFPLICVAIALNTRKTEHWHKAGGVEGAPSACIDSSLLPLPLPLQCVIDELVPILYRNVVWNSSINSLQSLSKWWGTWTMPA